MGRGEIIETGVDRLISLVRRKKRVSIQEAAKALSVPQEVIDEWASFLDEEGVLSIEYKFTTPYLVERKLTREELTRKAKEFGIKKEYFVRKAESALEFLEKQRDSIELIKRDFTDLRTALGSRADALEKEFAQLAQFDSAKRDVEKKILKHESDFRKQLLTQSRAIEGERKKYQHLIEELRREKRTIIVGQEKAMSLRQQEAHVMKQLTQLNKVIQKLRQKVIDEDNYILHTEENLRRLLSLSSKISKNIDIRRERISTLMSQGKREQDALIAKQEEIVRKLLAKSAKLSKEKDTQSKSVKKLKAFFTKKHKVEKLLSDVNAQHEKLRHDLVGLIRKAKVFNVYIKNKKNQKHVAELRDSFSTIEKRKKGLQRKVGDLARAFASLAK